MTDIEFNLLREPWIRIRMPNYTVKEVSLSDALLHAHEYKDLAGEMPTQNAAITRLLLAILHTVFSRVDENGNPIPLESTDDALERWANLWELGKFPEQPIKDYFEQWQDRFWLFHPERPFWQVAQVKNGIEFDGKKLNGERAESGNTVRLFQSISEDACSNLTYAQAARWLFSLNGYDERGGRPKAGNKPRHGVGWLGQIGFVMVKGQSLFETLMRNMVLAENEDDLIEPQKPCWELEQVRADQSTEIPVPQNAAELLTMQSRRIILKRSSTMESVVGYELLGGDYFDPRNAFSEKMTIWRKVSKKDEEPVYMPQQHDPSRRLWDEFPTILGADGHMPGVLNWNLQLQNAGILSNKELIAFQIVGVQYDSQEASVKDCFTDQLSMRLEALNALKRPWAVRIQNEVSNCIAVADAITRLDKELKLSEGMDYSKLKKFKDVQKMTAASRTQFYFSVDLPFRQWLQSIDPEKDDPTEKTEQWHKQIYGLAARLGKQMVEHAGPTAFVGRRIMGEKTQKDYLHTAPKAYNNFLRDLSRLFFKG